MSGSQNTPPVDTNRQREAAAAERTPDLVVAPRIDQVQRDAARVRTPASGDSSSTQAVQRQQQSERLPRASL